MIYPLVNDLLRIKTIKYEFGTTPLSSDVLIRNMTESVKQYKGLGLSCNQVGIPYSMFIMKTGYDSYLPVFNPNIVHFSEEQEIEPEGCLSFKGLNLKIKRSKSIRMRYQNDNGEVQTKIFDGLAARIVQHETDHLNGICFTNHAGRVKLENALKEAKKKGFHFNMKDLIDGNHKI